MCDWRCAITGSECDAGVGAVDGEGAEEGAVTGIVLCKLLSLIPILVSVLVSVSYR